MNGEMWREREREREEERKRGAGAEWRTRSYLGPRALLKLGMGERDAEARGAGGPPLALAICFDGGGAMMRLEECAEKCQRGDAGGLHKWSDGVRRARERTDLSDAYSEPRRGVVGRSLCCLRKDDLE